MPRPTLITRGSQAQGSAATCGPRTPASRQPSLWEFADDAAAVEPKLRPLAGVQRVELGLGAWLDILPAWLSGPQALFNHLSAAVPWRSERRVMFDRIVHVPRLDRHYPGDEPLPHPVIEQARDELSRYYFPELREPFVSVGLCLYRDGTDSVAWHGDRIGRAATEDTMVAILSVGAARTLALRPRTGGPSRRISLGHGDLAVMGGSCQRTWDHAIPKSSTATGPRISLQFRTRGVR